MNRIITILYGLIWSIGCNAQVTGIVIDLETRKPVSNVHLYLDTNMNVVADWAGRFHTDAKFKSATISHFKYVARKMKREEMRDTIYLLPKMNTLSEVVVYGRNPGPKFKYNNMTSIDRQLANYKGGGFNILGLAALAINALVKDKHKMSKRDRTKMAIENY